MVVDAVLNQDDKKPAEVDREDWTTRIDFFEWWMMMILQLSDDGENCVADAQVCVQNMPARLGDLCCWGSVKALETGQMYEIDMAPEVEYHCCGQINVGRYSEKI